jgi:hypothetical protein
VSVALFLESSHLLGEQIDGFHAELVVVDLAIDVGYFLIKMVIVEKLSHGFFYLFLLNFLAMHVGQFDSQNIGLGIDQIDFFLRMGYLSKDVGLFIADFIDSVLEFKNFGRVHLL